MLNLNELKLCPFCGGEPVIKQASLQAFTIGCVKCDFRLFKRRMKKSEEDLIDVLITAWNKRYES